MFSNSSSRVVRALLLFLAFAPSVLRADDADRPDVLESQTARVVLRGAKLQKGAVLLDVGVNSQRVWSANPKTDLAPVLVATPKNYPVQLEIELKGAPVATAIVRPISENVATNVEDSVVKLTVERPGNLTVEFDGVPERAAHLFLAAPDADAKYLEKLERSTAARVLRFEEGFHDVGRLELRDDDVLYLAPGAILGGGIVARNARGAQIFGRGIVLGARYDRWDDQIVGVNIESSEDVEIDGITILDPAAWSLQLYKCKNATVRNAQIVGSRSNSDGVSIQSSENVRVEDVFVRSWDDSLVVKGYDGDARNVVFERATLWTDLAQSMEIGYETRAAEISGIVFRDVCVLHNFHKAVVSIHNSDTAKIRDVLFENVVVEDAQMGLGDGVPRLIDFSVESSQWSKRALAGSIRDVRVSNLQVLDGRSDLELRFFSQTPSCNVDRISIEGLRIRDELVDSWDKIPIQIDANDGGSILLEGRPLPDRAAATSRANADHSF